MRRVLAVSIGFALAVVSGTASAFVFQRAEPIRAGSYAVVGIDGNAEFQKLIQQPYRTASGRSLTIPITDAIRPGRANMAANALKLMRATPGSLAVGLAASAVAGILADSSVSLRSGVIEKEGTSYNTNTSFTSDGFWLPSAWSSGEIRDSVEGALSRGRAQVEARKRSGTTVTFDAPTLGSGTSSQRFRIMSSGAQAYTNTINVSHPTASAQPLYAPATDAELLAALSAPNTTDPRLKEVLEWLKQNDVALDLDGSEAASLSAPAQSTAAYDQSTTTNPDGSTTTKSSTDTVTTTATGNGSAVAGNTATTTETKTTTQTGPEGTTTTTTIIDTTNIYEDDQNPEQYPNGTLSLPGLPPVKTPEQSFADLSTRIANAPVLAGVSDLPDLVPSGGSCPTASFQALGSTFNLEAHCPLIEQARPVISMAFLLAWALASVFIFLRA